MLTIQRGVFKFSYIVLFNDTFYSSQSLSPRWLKTKQDLTENNRPGKNSPQQKDSPCPNHKRPVCLNGWRPASQYTVYTVLSEAPAQTTATRHRYCAKRQPRPQPPDTESCGYQLIFTPLLSLPLGHYHEPELVLFDPAGTRGQPQYTVHTVLREAPAQTTATRH
ncbi:hypothetical protein J6590_060977 [Homalodisca vitripennis]|nr:hypothetical protein J6590_060977 [Homalodisca vitripennis]